MNFYQILFFISFNICTYILVAQNFTISGYVKDANSGEQIIAANVYVTNPLKGTTTNHYGFFHSHCQKAIILLLYQLWVMKNWN